MADEDEKQQEETTEESGGQDKTEAKRSLLPWILLGTIVPVFAGTGFFLGRILAEGHDEVPEVKEVEEEEPIYAAFLNPDADASPTWIYEVAPFVSNLRDPGARRYVRVGFSLEMSAQLAQEPGKNYLDSKKAHISNRLGHYFGDRAVEELQGERNRRKILADIEDILNELLFKDAKPPIVSVLFGECAIQ